jgi:hypothetical protein
MVYILLPGIICECSIIVGELLVLATISHYKGKSNPTTPVSVKITTVAGGKRTFKWIFHIYL